MKKLARIFLAVIAITSMSCEIGLGASVDTEPPSITIDTPEVDSVIRDKFLIGGSWSDDGSIAELKVKIKKTDGSGIEHEYDGKLENDPENRGSGRWSVLVEPEAEDGTRLVIDGSYQATASIKDAMGRITTQSTTFSIDNTPPVIVLTRPSTGIDSVSADTYGQTFNLEGQAADTNSVDLIEVRIYSDRECTNLVHTVNLHQVPNSINMDVAKFKRGDTENDYYKIYGESETGAGEKTFYCRIIAYDGAKRYPVDGSAQSEEDLKGNAIDTYYLYKDIATSLFTNYGLKITEVYSILNGTYAKSDNSRAVNTSDIVKILESSKKTTGKFSLNPKNNPTYSVTGRNPLNLDGKDFTGSANNISNGQKVVIEVSPGLDGILLEKDSLKVYAAECDEKGNITGEKIYPALDADQPAESGTSYRFTTPVSLADGFKIGRNYVWGVEGYDQSEAKNSVECAAKAYGFHMATSGKAPELSLTEPVKSNTYIGRGGKQIFSGKVKVEAGSPVVTIYRKYTENGEVKEEAVKSFSYNESEGKETDSELEYEFTYTVESFGNKSAQFDYRIAAEQDGQETSADRTVIYDMDPPKISMLGSSPSTENILKYDPEHEEKDGESGYINGNVTFTFAVADDFDAVDECTYSVVRKSDGKELLAPVKMTKPTREEFTIATGEIADGTQILLVIEAKDRSGNTTKSGDEVNPAEYSYTVDQETDKPVLLPGDAGSITFTKLQSKEAYDSQSGAKKNLATIGSTLQFRLHDDDGLKGIKIRNSASAVTSDEQAVQWTDYTVQNLSGTDTTFSYTLPTEGGLYRFEAVVTDRNGLENEYKFVINAVKPAAEISQITVEAKKGTGDVWEAKNISSSAVRNCFTIDESEGPYTLYRMINSGDFPNTLPSSSSGDIYVKGGLAKGEGSVVYDGSVQYKDIIEAEDLNEGINTIYYLIQDGNGRKGSIKYTQVIKDTTVPAVTINEIDEQDKYIPSKNFKFTGTLTEANHDTLKAGLRGEDGSSVLMGNGQVIPDEALNPALSGGDSYEWTYRMDDLADGVYKVNIYAKDRAGNENASGGQTSQKTLVVDTKYPKITMNSSVALKDGNGNSVNELINGGIYYVAGGFRLEGSITETNTDTISFKDGNTALTFTEGVDASGNWKYEQPESNGLHAYSLTVKDKAGNESEFKVSITIDTAGPTVNEVTNPASDTRKGVNSLTDSTYIFRGNVHDNEGGTGVSKIFYAFTTSETAPADSDYTPMAASNGEWSIVKTIEDGPAAGTEGNLHEGKWKLYVKAQDKAGKLSGVTVREFDLDKNPPVLTESHSADFGFKNTAITLSGSASDSYGLKSVTITEGSFTRTVTVTDGNWSLPLNPASDADNLEDGEHTFTITAEDNIGKKTILTRKVTFDHQDPTVSFNTPLPTGQSYGSAAEPSAVTFSGYAQDSGASGLDKVQIKFSDGSIESGWLDATVTGNIWTYTLSDLTAAELSGVFSEEGTKTVNIKAKDRAGNETEETQGTTIYDRHDPSVSDVKYKTSATDTTGEDLTSGAKKYRNTGSFILEGSYSDNLTGVTVSVMKNGTELSPELLDTSVSGKWKITETSIADDSYTYVITAKDSSGRTASFTVPLVVDTIRPSVGFGIDSVSEAEYNRGTYQFTGSVTDKNLKSSITAGLFSVTVDGNGAESERAVTGWQNKTVYPQKNSEEDGYDWTFFVNDLAEGKYKLQIDAEDEAGNQNAESNRKSQKLLIVDTTLPVINAVSDGNIYTMEGTAVELDTPLTSALDEYFAKGSFTLSGSVTDSYFKSVTVKEGETELTSVSSETSATGEWSFHYTHTQGTTQDGLHTYTVTAEDEAGNRSVRTIKVTVDTTPPSSNDISSPDNTRTGTGAISDNSFIFSGIASDAAGGTGVARIWYAFTKSSDVPGTEQEPTSGYASVTAGNGSSWNLAKTINTNATDVTSVTTGNLSEGNWYLHVKAQDKAGNVSSAQSAQTVHFDIDKSAPSSAVSVDGNKDKFNKADLNADQKGSITIKGNADDSFGLDGNAAVTLSIYKDGNTEAYKTVVIPSSDVNESHAWTREFVFGSGYGDSPSEENYLPQGSYEVKAVAKDKVGKTTTSSSASFVIDYTPPAISVTNADSAADAASKTWYKGSGSTYIAGTATENGSGIASMQIKIDNADNWSPLPPQADWTYSYVLADLSENTADANSYHTIKVKITDKAGNVNADDGEVYYFRYDKAAPGLTMASDNETINGAQGASITISGTVSDGGTRNVKSLVLTATKDDSAYTFTQSGNTQTSLSSQTLNGNYTYTLNGSDLAEGSYVFTVTATDYAGQTAQKSVNAIVDKTIPDFTKIRVGSGENEQDIFSTSDNSVTGSGTTKWYKSQTQSIAVYATDALSGIETVEYRTASASSAVTDENAEWQPLTKKSETGPGNTTIIVYRGTAAFSDEAAGKGSRLHIRVTDKAGNSQKFYTKKLTAQDTGLDYVVFNIDTSKPALALSKVQIGSNAAKATAGTEYINSETENTLTLYGTYSNNISGVAGLNFYKNNTETALSASSVEYYAAPLTANTAIESLSYAGYDTITDKSSITAWKAVFANASLPEASGDIIVRGESVAGVSSGNLKLFTLNRDNTKPQLNNITITADDVNHTVYKKTVGTTDYYYLNNTAGTYRITAQAEDNTGTSETSASGVYNVTLNIPGITPDKNSASAQFTDINLSGISGKGSFAAPLTVKLTITDNAGNTEDYTRNIVFDTQAPSAEHEHDDKGKDLYFRVGSSDNTDNKDITTGDAVFNDAKDKDVGGKYGSNTYGNDTTIKLRGNFADEADGSGVKAIHYMVYQGINKPADTFGVIPENATEAQIASALSDALSIKNNGKSFTLSAPSTRRVFYNVKETDGNTLGGTELAGSASSGYKKYYKEITTNFFESLSGFVPGNNYLVLAAEDNVGNIKVDVVTIGSGGAAVTYNNFSLNVDQTKPDVQQKDGFEFSHEYISNATAPQVIEFDILEEASGIEKNDFSQNTDFTVTLGSQTLTVEAAQKIPETTDENYAAQKAKNLIVVGTKNETTNRWPVKLQVGTTALGNAADGSKPSVTVTVKDKASNGSSPTQVGIMKMDKTAPVPSISKPSANATVNKTITVTGNIEEVNDVSSVTFTASSGSGDSSHTLTYQWPTQAFNAANNYDVNTYVTYQDGNVPNQYDIYRCTTAHSAGAWNASHFMKVFTFDTTSKEWSAVIDTTEFYNGTESQTLTLSITATDNAGNVYDYDSATSGNQALTRSITIDQKSDRPIIKVSQIDSTGTGFVKVKTMFGTVNDDDRNDDVTVNKLWLWQKQEGKNSNLAPLTAPSYDSTNGNWTGTSGWLEFGGNTNSSLDNNSWQLESDESDGESTWYWAVADRNNNVFWTCAQSQLERPYIIFKGETTESDNTTGLSFLYDTIAPEITKVEFLRLATDVYKEGTNRYAADEIEEYITEMNDNGSNLSWISDDNYVFGKDKALMYIKAEVKEESGMAEWDPDTETGPLALEGFDNTITIDDSSYSVSEPDADKKYTYIIGPVDLSSYNLSSTAEGYPRLTLTFRALDAAGKSTEKTKPVIIDNSASITMEKITPAPQNETSGEFTFRAQVSDKESSVADVKYYIPQSTQTIPTSPDADSYTWNEVDDLTAIQIAIEFTDFNSILGYQTSSGGTATVATGFQSYDIGGTGANAQGVYNIPVWFKVTDEVGNIGYVKQYVIKDANGNITSTNNNILIKYNPNTDRPKVYITSPEVPENATYVEKGGKIKISGSAEDNEGIAGVYLQFDMGDGNGFVPSPDGGTGELIPGTGTPGLYGTKANNTKNWNYTLNVGGIADKTTVKVRAIAVDIDTTNVQLSSAWSDELSIKVNNSIPAFGSMKLVNVDTGAEIEYQPGMYIKGNWTLHGTVTTPNSDQLNSLSIGGKLWERTGTNTGSWNADGAYTGATVNYTNTTDDKSISFTIPVTVGSNESSWTIDIMATDESEHDNADNPQINIDNDAPLFADYVPTTDSTATVKAGRQIKLYQDSYGPAGRMLDETTNLLQNSNGAKFTLAGKVIEPASGFEKAVFYIERRGNDGENRIYNPMEGHGTDNTENRTNIASSDDDDAVNETHPVYINDDGLPVRALTVTRDSSKSESLANDEIKTNLNIRQGGLVYIGGLYRTITAVDRDTGTVTIDPADEVLTNTSAQFVYGMVVDSTGEGENSDGSIRETDGDQLLESYSGSQTANYRWEATFDSSNIPDGPVNVHVVLFDQAGNISHGYAVTRASNNAPRITKVMIGTDLNGNGKYDFGSGEFSEFYAQKDDNNNPNTKTGKKAWTLDTSEEDSASKLWKVKSGLAVIPEFVGGAGPFYYNFSTGEAEIEEAQKISSNESILTQDYLNNYKLKASGANDLIKQSGTDINASWSYSTNKVNGSDVTNSGGSLTLTNKQITGKDTLTNADDAAEIFYSFTFWDSTDDSTPGFDTGSTILNLKVEQDLTDGETPSAKIKPFTWSGTGFTKTVTETKNGVEQSPVSDVVTTLETSDILGTKITTEIDSESGDVTVTKTVITPKNSIYGASLANGHIELESDLPDDILYGTDDPKVSGKITFHGTAYDDTRLSSIWFKFTDFTADSGLTQTTTDGVTIYDASTTALNGYTQAAWYNPATALWVNAPARMESYTTTDENDQQVTVPSSHWEFTVSDRSFDQSGHEVDWYLSIDTAYITNTVGLDKALSVISLDAAGSPSDTSSVQTTTTTNTPYYSMDVVPYVTSLTTYLSDFQSNNPSVYDRTALGHYPVYMTHAQGNGTYTYETIEVNGFNLYGTKMKFENVATPAAIGAYKDQNPETKEYPAATSLAETKHYRLAIPAGLKSGKIAVWSDDTGTIKSLNNLNDNDAKGNVTGSALTEAGGYTGCYNRQPNGVNNNRLTDDLEIDVWDFNSQAAKAYGNGTIGDAIMKINPNTGILGFAFSNSSERFSMGGYVNGNADANEYSYYQWNMTFDAFRNNGFAYDSSGHSYGASSGGDISDSPNWDFFSFMSDRWGRVGERSGANKNNQGGGGGVNGWNGGRANTHVRPEGIGQYGNVDNPNSGSDWYIRKDRIQSVSIATHRESTTSTATHIYLAYYDLLNDEIRFRFCDLGNTQKPRKNNEDQTHELTGTFRDVYSCGNDLTNNTSGNGKRNYSDTANTCQIVASNTESGTYAGSKTLGNAGNAVAIGVTSDDYVVMVWYDAENNNLLYSYNTTPTTTQDTVNGTSVSRLGASKAGWATRNNGAWVTNGSGKPLTLIPNAGENCQLVVDSDNGIHVVAYDSNSGDLKYAYLSSYNDASPKVCTVDSYLDTGYNLSIDVAKETIDDDEYQIPHIGYWSAFPEKAHYAYLKEPAKFYATTNYQRDGATTDDKYTGIWENGLVPSPVTVREGKVNVGVWKNTSGVRRDSNYTGTSGANAAGTNKSTSSSANTTSGVCYGNGTDKAVLAYITEANSSTYYIETAQMR